MRIQRLLSFLLCIVAGSSMAWAADCMNGRGELQRPLWDGYTLSIAPATGERVNECRAAVAGPDGKPIFEMYGVDASMLRATGRDVNGDGKPDVVLLTHKASAPDNIYSIVGTADPAGLIRQIVTSADLSFEERVEGKIDIVTHDTSFRDFEGMSAEQLPPPMLFLRMRGREIYNVSQVYWPEYERDIAQARAKLSKNDIADLKGESPKQKNEQNKDPSPQDIAHLQDVKGTVLQIVLDYIYGGKGQDAWKTLGEMWPYNDRQRIREDILRARMAGVMRDISRPVPAAAPPTASK